jgi:RNA polymerase sigma factor (sigma-70 family)
MLHSLVEADDAVQETWLRLRRSAANDIENLGGWLTTVVARVCLDMLRSREAKSEESLAAHESEPVAMSGSRPDPEHEAVMAQAVGVALLVVLDRLTPAERLAFVLHDMFAVSFEECGKIAEVNIVAAQRAFASSTWRSSTVEEHSLGKEDLFPKNLEPGLIAGVAGDSSFGRSV